MGQQPHPPPGPQATKLNPDASTCAVGIVHGLVTLALYKVWTVHGRCRLHAPFGQLLVEPLQSQHRGDDLLGVLGAG